MYIDCYAVMKTDDNNFSINTFLCRLYYTIYGMWPGSVMNIPILMWTSLMIPIYMPRGWKTKFCINYAHVYIQHTMHLSLTQVKYWIANKSGSNEHSSNMMTGPEPIQFILEHLAHIPFNVI